MKLYRPCDEWNSQKLSLSMALPGKATMHERRMNCWYQVLLGRLEYDHKVHAILNVLSRSWLTSSAQGNKEI
jgi:hypothetical protein